MRQMCGNPSLITRTKNVRRVAKETFQPGAFSDISNISRSVHCFPCILYSIKRVFKAKIAFFEQF